MPVLAFGAEKTDASQIGEDLRFVADNITSAVIANSGHWTMQEQPAAPIEMIRTFLTEPET